MQIRPIFEWNPIANNSKSGSEGSQTLYATIEEYVQFEFNWDIASQQFTSEIVGLNITSSVAGSNVTGAISGASEIEEIDDGGGASFIQVSVTNMVFIASIDAVGGIGCPVPESGNTWSVINNTGTSATAANFSATLNIGNN